VGVAGAIWAGGGLNISGGSTPTGSANILAYGNNVLYVGGSGGCNVASGNDSGAFFVNGGSANNGSGVKLHGSTHPSDASIGRLTVGASSVVSWTSSNVTIASGVGLQLGNAYASGAPTATGYIVIKDSTGTSYKIPAVAL
jgi:hypothetical protein